MIKIYQSYMLMKLTPSRRSRRVDSSGIFDFKNGLHMREKVHSEVLWKHAKKGLHSQQCGTHIC